jgi:GNAT superfamily N-acetyltransferase
MAFTFGRGERIGRWLREKPKSFLDWEKIEGVLTPELCNQHKQEEGTPMLLDQATSRNVSRALNEINGFDWEGDFKPMALQVLKDLVQKQLEEEMAEYLGLSRYEHALDRPDYRNGYYIRHLLTEMGDLELVVPRRRKGGFPTKLFERYARRCRSEGLGLDHLTHCPESGSGGPSLPRPLAPGPLSLSILRWRGVKEQRSA